MAYQPHNTKYRKIHKGKIQSYNPKAQPMAFGNYAIVALESVYLDGPQLEAGRQTITRHLERQGRVWVKVFPNLGITKRPSQIRIGKGTGTVKYWVVKIRPGTVIYEVAGVPADKALEAIVSASHKLPIRVKLII
jgi:large subunit ribosomal protein L16